MKPQSRSSDGPPSRFKRIQRQHDSDSDSDYSPPYLMRTMFSELRCGLCTRKKGKCRCRKGSASEGQSGSGASSHQPILLDLVNEDSQSTSSQVPALAGPSSHTRVLRRRSSVNNLSVSGAGNRARYSSPYAQASVTFRGTANPILHFRDSPSRSRSAATEANRWAELEFFEMLTDPVPDGLTVHSSLEPLLVPRADDIPPTDGEETPAAEAVTAPSPHQQQVEQQPPTEETTPTSNHAIGNAELLEKFECPVCCEPIVPPILQCRRGHLICAKCKEKPEVSCCPTCRGPFSDCRNLLGEKIALMLKYPCRNVGCPLATLLTERAAHEAACAFRLFKCPLQMPPCLWTGVRPVLHGHLSAAHPNRFLQGSVQQIDVPLNSANFFDWAISCYDQLFRLNVYQHRSDSTFHAAVFLVNAPEEESSKFTYTITVRDKNGNQDCTRRRTHAETVRMRELCQNDGCFFLRGGRMAQYSQESQGVLRLNIEIECVTETNPSLI